MEKQFPKNVRQIGNVCDSPKIYVEDYVDTFLNQLCDKMEEEPQGAFLIGEKGQVEDQDCVYMSQVLMRIWRRSIKNILLKKIQFLL